MSAGLIGNARTSKTTSPAPGAPTSATSAQRRPSSGWPYRSSSICFIGSPPSTAAFRHAALVIITGCPTRTRLNVSAAANLSRHAAAPRKPSAVRTTARTSAATTVAPMAPCRLTRRRPNARRAISGLFEVDPLVHRQPLEMAAQAVEPHLAGTQAHPLAPAENATAPGIGPLGGRDRQVDGTAEVDPVGAVVEIDQHRQRVAGAGVAPRRLRHRFRRLAGQLARRRGPLEADAGEDLGEVAGPDAAAEDLLRARERHEAGGDLSAGERLDDRQRALTVRELRQNDALQRLIVLGQDEVAEAPAHFALYRDELCPDVVHIGAAHGQLGLELRVVGAEAELHAPVGHELVDAGEQRVHVRFAEPVRVESLQVDGRLHTALREEPRNDLLLDHAAELARHPGGEEEAGTADVE